MPFHWVVVLEFHRDFCRRQGYSLHGLREVITNTRSIQHSSMKCERGSWAPTLNWGTYSMQCKRVHEPLPLTEELLALNGCQRRDSLFYFNFTAFSRSNKFQRMSLQLEPHGTVNWSQWVIKLRKGRHEVGVIV